MNSEPNSAAGSEAPTEAPAAAIAAAPEAAMPDAAAAPDEVADDDAPDTVPDQLRDLPADTPPVAASSAASSPAVAGEAPAAAPKVPELSPAVTGTRLAALFPALFVGPDGKGTWQPIKLRIHADIQARAPGEFTKRTLGIFFSRYTTTTAYLKALASAPQRVDLDGQAAGEISEEHRQLARDELARRQALAAERRAAMRPPRRDRPAGGEGDANPATQPEREREAGPRPESQGDGPAEARPQRRPDNRPPGRPPQRPRGDSPAPEQRDTRRRDGAPPQAERPPQPPRPSRPPRQADHAPRTAPQAHSAPAARDVRREERREEPIALPADPAQRERAMLLRSFESSPLSKANFCALKGMSEATLDAALAQAQAERGWPAPASPASFQQRGSNRR